MTPDPVEARVIRQSQHAILINPTDRAIRLPHPGVSTLHVHVSTLLISWRWSWQITRHRDDAAEMGVEEIYAYVRYLYLCYIP